MNTSIKNPKTLRRSNKINLLYALMNGGDMSRLMLSERLGLTGASITQLVQELMHDGLVVEGDTMQRNNTGRREVMLRFNATLYGAVGVNIEQDKIHISVCNYTKVLSERIFVTSELIIDGVNIDRLIAEIKADLERYCDKVNIIGVGVGIAGEVDEKNGISIDSHGILPCNYPLLKRLSQDILSNIFISNNVTAQAKALIIGADDNFMFVKHSPGVGCALVMNGDIVGGYDLRAGELGHTIVEMNGDKCVCGKSGCLETVVGERAIERKYYENSAISKKIDEIYSLYNYDSYATSVLDNAIDKLAISIGNAIMLINPKRVMLTGGIFFNLILKDKFLAKINVLGYPSESEIVFVDNDKKIKAFAGARLLLRKKLFEV